MKTISLRELHNKTGKWMRSVADEEELIVTDRGTAIASIVPYKRKSAKKKTWANRTLLPEFAAAMKAGLLKTTGDSSVCISEDRTSRDNSVAGIEE
jgi:prevent-host-death family protein